MDELTAFRASLHATALAQALTQFDVADRYLSAADGTGATAKHFRNCARKEWDRLCAEMGQFLADETAANSEAA